jgi:RNA-dependent RNA polymerase
MTFDRLGQCLSTTYSVKECLQEDQWRVIEDCKSADGRFEYTDGCGKVSPETAAELACQLGLPEVPSAFQIRFRGCKGVLVVFPLAEVSAGFRIGVVSLHLTERVCANDNNE